MTCSLTVLLVSKICRIVMPLYLMPMLGGMLGTIGEMNAAWYSTALTLQ